MEKATLILLVLFLVVRTQAYLTGRDNIQKVLSRERRSPCDENFFVAFDATLKDHFTSGTNGDKVVFNDIQTNIGDHFKNGVFKVPRNGVYQFQWNILSYPGKSGNTALVVGGKVMKLNHSNSQIDRYNSGSASAILQLRKDEQVWIQTRKGYSNKIYGGWSSFQGLILQTN